MAIRGEEMDVKLLLLSALPIVGGVLVSCVGRWKKNLPVILADLVMLVQILLLALLGYQYMNPFLAGGENPFFFFDMPWMGLRLSFVLDGVRLLFCLLVTVVFGVVLQFVRHSMEGEPKMVSFYCCYLVAYGANLGAVLSGNLGGFLVFGTAAVLHIYPLLVHRMKEKAVKGAFIYCVFALIAMFVMLLGDILLHLHEVRGFEGAYTRYLETASYDGVRVFGIMLTVGFAIWAGLVPVQFMITRGSTYGMIEVSAVLNNSISKLGLVGLLLVGTTFFPGSVGYGRLLLLLGCATAIWGLVVAITSTDIRKILMGVHVVMNGLAVISGGVMVHAGRDNAYAVRSSLYLVLISTLSLLVLYMVALELVRKKKTYEIKGLIASGKKHPLLFFACFLACASLIGMPGTAGFLAYSLLFKSINTMPVWSGLGVLYLILWSWLVTAISRIFMKLFISKKEETIHIMSEETLPAEEGSGKKEEYPLGEFFLLCIGLLQVVAGVVPGVMVNPLSEAIGDYFFSTRIEDALSYYTMDGVMAFIIAFVIGVIIYFALVHGVFLRSIKEKKNKKLLEERQERNESM